ncbi:hypothetical protein U1Q18_007533, partial [Sarracenia purpurea var. burkii]
EPSPSGILEGEVSEAVAEVDEEGSGDEVGNDGVDSEGDSVDTEVDKKGSSGADLEHTISAEGENFSSVHGVASTRQTDNKCESSDQVNSPLKPSSLDANFQAEAHPISWARVVDGLPLPNCPKPRTASNLEFIAPKNPEVIEIEAQPCPFSSWISA